MAGRSPSLPTGTTPSGARPVANGGGWADRFALIIMLVAFLALVVIQLGPALLGFKTFSGVDVLTAFAPWDDRWLTETWQSPWVGDTIDAMLPGYMEANRRLFSGELPLWSSLGGPGTPLLSSTSMPVLTPSAVWLLVTPTWWAIGFTKFVQLIMAFGGMVLWLRRLGTGWAAGAVAGLLYCSSGFFVSWSGWVPQAGVAATIPVLFWVIERFLALRTAASAGLLSVVVAWLLLGGFPAVAGHALYAGALYFLVRCVCERRRLGLRGVAYTVAGGGAAVAVGIGLSAIQLLPLVRSLAQIDTGYRSNQFDGQLPVRSFISAFFPRIFNSDGGIQQLYGANTNPIEAYAFVGMGAVALAVLALVAGRWHGIARGVIPVLVVVGLLAAALAWRHGFWTDWLRNVPVFADNSSARLRDMVSFTVCALAGIGFNVLFSTGLPGHVRRRLVVGSWLILAIASGATVLAWRRYSPAVDDRTFLVDAGFGLLTVLAVAVAFTVAQGRTRATADPALDRAPLTTAPPTSGGQVGPGAPPAGQWVREPINGHADPDADDPGRLPEGGAAADSRVGGPRPGRRRSVLLTGSVVLIGALLFAQAFLSTEYFWPTSDVADFYPDTPGVQAAAAATGEDRAVTLGGVFLGSSGMANDIRTVTGHSFQAQTWKDLLLAVDPKSFTPPGKTPTNPRLDLSTSDGSLDTPLLDRLSAATVLASPGSPVPGPVVTLQGEPTAPPQGAPTESVTVGAAEVPAGNLRPQALRGFLVNVASAAGNGRNGIRITATVRDAAGAAVATGSSIRQRWEPGWTQIAVAGEALATTPGPLSVSVSVDARDVPGQTLQLAGQSGVVTALVIGSQPDRLRLSYADSQLQVWERPSALPRVRWATASEVVEDPTQRLAALANPATPPTTVVLSAPGPQPSGGSAQLSVREDTGDEMVIDVNAEAAGYVVVADALQNGWAAEVNGEPADLVDADHAFGAVFVPAGASVVTLTYVGSGLRTGALITAVSLVILVSMFAGPPVIRAIRRRRTPRSASPQPGPASATTD